MALMVEDFQNASSTTPFSKIPIQFLVYVYSSSGPCSSAPEFVDPTPKDEACIGIAPNETYFQQLIAKTGADEVRYEIFLNFPCKMHQLSRLDCILDIPR